MKILIFSHMPEQSRYGAPTSLRLHLAILAQSPNLKLASIFGRSIRLIRQEFTANSNFLPFSFNYDAWADQPLGKLFSLSYYLLFLLNQQEIYEKIIGFQPQIIQLNSLVLLPLVKWLRQKPEFQSLTIISHVRELLSYNLPKNQVNQLSLVDRFICIDQSTKQRLLTVKNDLPESRIAVIDNPFTGVIERSPKIMSLLDQSKYIFAMTGRIYADKGVNFVCETFLSANLANACLVIVGKGGGKYYKDFLRLSTQNRDKILFLGEIDELHKTGFYSLVDCVVRGDETFRTGRTIYEGLYVQTRAIIPGEITDLEQDEHLIKFRNQICMYPPLDSLALQQAITKTYSLGKQPILRTATNNFAEYFQSFNRFYNSL